MDLSSFGLEVKAIRSITNAKMKSSLRMSMLGRLGIEHFANEVTRKAFRRVSKLASARGELLSWSDLLADPNLPEEYRDYLNDADAKPVSKLDRFAGVVEQLDKYRIRRHLADIARSIAETIEGDVSEDFDEDTCLREVANKLQGAYSKTTEEVVYTFGKSSNIKKMVKQVLHKPTERLYKTGYSEYDNKNGGFPTTGVVLLAGATSSGKSVLSMNLLRQMHELNAISVLKITLEMTAEQEMNRILSMLSGVPFAKIKQNQLTDKEKAKITKAAMKFDAECKARKSSFMYAAPSEGMSIDDVLYMGAAYNTKVLCLDYVGLLEGLDDDSQWRKMSEIVRKAKIFSARTGTLVVILCQLDEESGKIRYSKGMREHADVVWAWNYSDPELRETRHIPVEIIKVRDGQLFTMPLKEAFDTMRVDNPDGNVPEFAAKSRNKSFSKSADDSDGKARRRALLDGASDDSDPDPPRKLGSKKDKSKDKLRGVKVKTETKKKPRQYLVE